MKIGNKILIVVIAVIGLYAAFLIYSDINTISSKISDFKIEIIPIILLLVTSGWFVLFFRWHLLLRNAKIFIPVKDSFLILTSGFALTIIPGKVGELVKSQLLKTKFGIARSKTIPIVILEQFYQAIGIVTLSFFGIWYFELGAYVLGFFTAALVFVFVLLSSRKAFNKIVSLLGRRKFTSKLVEPLSSSYDGIKNGIKGPITLYASSLSILFWLIEAISIYFILLAFGVEVIEFLTVIPTYTTSIMLGILSFLPMGIGVVEGTLASFFTMHGIDISLALTIVIVIRLFTRWYSVSFGFIALKLSGGLTNNQEPNDSKS
ncbi:flippase-like domain-containing protein [Marine Group I thaumarchaeote]|uniref:Flippase-like domain-containing protein n=1 Tax=Marine Group I thaumarchaeote TaxID=2511932 RepID=A0A7K4NLC6_9ARCH|nr:flippase-like domain-containing protein [Marine Group I thaumarchaeote]